MPTAFTAAMKLAAVEREIKFRRGVYLRMVANEKMSQAFADEQIAVFQAIAADYRQAAEKERLF